MKKNWIRRLNFGMVRNGAVNIVRYVFLIGISFIILQPFLVRFLSSLMSVNDVYDSMVQYIPREPSLENYQAVIEGTGYFTALFNTTFLSIGCALLQVLICTCVGYGLAKFPFRGRTLIFCLVVFSMVLPPQTFFISLYLNMRFFDPFMILSVLGLPKLNIVDGPYSLLVLSLTGFAFKNGLYVILMRQLFKGVPEEIREAAEVDGAGQLRIFFRIMFPTARNMMVTIFLLSFSWQWTDTFYSSLFFSNFKVLSNILDSLSSIRIEGLTSFGNFETVLVNTASILVILPLMALFLVAQKKLVQGIEHSGLVG
ncbi:MAG: carbohydrate ABC transporter permease [Oscillospiraceae bacterium]|nr:carbohydrate ABC transporter permease [Oscillospiraceae bacterium]